MRLIVTGPGNGNFLTAKHSGPIDFDEPSFRVMYGQDMATPNKLLFWAPGQFPTNASSRMIDRPGERYREHGAQTPSDDEEEIVCLETTRDGFQAFLKCCAPFCEKNGAMWGVGQELSDG